MGDIRLIKLKIGTWNGVFKCPGYVDQPVIVLVKSKYIVHFDIEMVAI